jgi:hypothetical protein
MNHLIDTIFSLVPTNTTQTKFHEAKKGKKAFTTAVLTFSDDARFQAYKEKLRSEEYGDMIRSLNLPVTYDHVLHDRENPVFQVEFLEESLQIHYKMNHYYIGGGQFWTILSNAIPEGQAKGPTLPESDFVLGAMLLPRMVFQCMLSHPTPVPRRPVQSENKVYTATYRMTIPKNKRFVTIHRVVQDLFSSLKLDGELRIAMTTAMKDLPHIKNNVGALFIELDQADSPDTIQRKCKDRSWMAYASNAANLLNVGLGSNVDMRKNVHCVFTQMYLYMPLEEFDFHGLPSSPIEENVYVGMMSFIEGNEVKVNVTYMTRLTDFVPTPDMTRVM